MRLRLERWPSQWKRQRLFWTCTTTNNPIERDLLMLLNLCNDENYFECDSSLVLVAVLFTFTKPKGKTPASNGVWLLQIPAERRSLLDGYIYQTQTRIVHWYKKGEFGKFKDFKRRNRTNPDLLYPAPNLLTNNAIAGQNMRLYFVL